MNRLNAAKVILAVRNLPQGEEVKKSIATTKRAGLVQVWKLDLSSFDSVKDFAKRATSELERLDILMLNASIAAGSFRMNEGYEASITVNVLSTFLLLFMILPVMEKTAKMSPPLPPRICITTSEVGSRTLVASAEVGMESHGEYMSDSEIKKENVATDGVSRWVVSDEGREMQRRLWSEIKGILNEIQPGVTKVIE